MTQRAFLIAAALSALFIYVAEGVPINPFVVYNWTPLVVSFLIFSLGKRKHDRRVEFGGIGFLVGSMLLSGYFHLAWMFDWGDSKTGSSTSGLIFIFIPIYSVVTGSIGYVVASAMARGSGGTQDGS